MKKIISKAAVKNQNSKGKKKMIKKKNKTKELCKKYYQNKN